MSPRGTNTAKKTRLAKACQRCRVRKIKCNGRSPCATCDRSGQECLYRAEAPRRRRRSLSPARLPNATQNSLPIFAPSSSPGIIDGNMLRAGLGVQCRETGALRFYGSISNYCFLHWTYLRLQNKLRLGAHFDSATGTQGIQRWGLNRFIFCPDRRPTIETIGPSQSIQLPIAMGANFIKLYFHRVHPLVPILDHDAISRAWIVSNTVRAADIDPDQYRLLQLVLAIGAFVAGRSQGSDIEASENWSQLLLRRASEGLDMFSELSLDKIHFIILRAVYSMQSCHVDEAYMYLGHAARTAIASGLTRSEIINEQGNKSDRFLITLWVLYYLERLSSLFAGRPSAFEDGYMNAPFPEVAEAEDRANFYSSPQANCGWVRSMACLAKIAGKLLALSAPSRGSLVADLDTLASIIKECEEGMKGIASQLPSYLDFTSPTHPIGDDWREIQRAHLGLMYHLTRLIMYRPLLQFASLFETRHEAQAYVSNAINLQAAIESSVQSSKLLIQLAYDVHSRRYPEIMYDTRTMSCLVHASVTLLYSVLEPEPDIDIGQVRENIDTVNLAVQCLNSVSNVQTLAGAQISTDIVDAVKDTWAAAGHPIDLDEGLLDILPWLTYFSPDGLFDLSDQA